MVFWNSNRLASAIPSQGIVEEFKPERVKNCADASECQSIDKREYKDRSR
jgi:hypothetical protein